ncbi:MAG: hypothetical protein K0U74_03305 [Alphaproteobacteria bacterium]|nr:hypothetical protein [Alphaproteobacteria bacterium]
MTNKSATLLSHAILQATEDNEKWADVLAALIEITGAVKGIMTLRDRQSAKLLLPDELTSNLKAPLIHGIEPDFVESYLDHYAALDPWTEIERANHPYEPYFMSYHLDFNTLVGKEFWNWLRPQGIVDALVAEIASSHRHWVALNLHFDSSCWGRQGEIIAQVQDLLPPLRTGWKLSEEVMGLRQGLATSQGYLENWLVPCLILDEDLIVTSANTLGLEEIHRHFNTCKKIQVGKPIEVNNGALRQALCDIRSLEQPNQGKQASLPSCIDGHTISLSVVAQATDIVGKSRGKYFIHVDPVASLKSAAEKMTLIWERPDLTPRQSAVVRAVAEGIKVKAYAEGTGITEKTAYDHLLMARKKMGNILTRDIYMTHQTYLSRQQGK